jgi:Tol biopolymer transport system component
MKPMMIVAALAATAACHSGSTADSGLPPVTVISSDSANQTSARVSPDGSRFFWWEPSGAGLQLWTATADLKNPVKVPVTSIGPTPILWSNDGRQIAIDLSDSGLAEVAVIPATGGMPRRVTHSIGLAVPIGWNPDGDRISYVATAGGTGGGTFASFVASMAHGGMTPLIPGESRPYVGSWTPDGSHVAYVVAEGNHTTIWAADSTGQHPRQLTTDGFEVVTSDQPVSPDGKWIAYQSSRTGTSDIWIVPIAGGTPRQLTRDVRNDHGGIWSPDGKWIAFLSDRGKQTDIWVVPMAGGPELRVTNDIQEEELVGWMPGNRLAFLTGSPESGIWSISLADSSEHRLTADSLRTDSPALSPDGKQIAFRVDHGGGISDIDVMPAAGGPLRVLVQGGNDSTISWSPVGNQIAYTSDAGGSRDVWVVDVATGAKRQLENWPSAESNPTWSGDGSVIYFTSDHEAKLVDIWKVSPAGGDPVRVTTQGAVNSVVTRRGRPEVFASVVNVKGRFDVVQIKPDGSLATVWQRSNSFPVDMTPAGDSVVIAENPPGGGGLAFRLVPVSGGEGRVLLQPGENFGALSDDGGELLYSLPNGSTRDIGVLSRADGATRRLTHTTADERSEEMSPDGKTVYFQRVRPSRRIAIADLSKLLGGTAR